MSLPDRRYRFDGFAFDPSSGELEGADVVTRLQPQAASLLAILIEHAGGVVSRAELQARLWPETTVEFDDGLNFCIRQLRVALGDDANAPRYIETLPKRGYRFLPAVTTEPSAGPRKAAPSATTSQSRWRWAGVVIISLSLIGAAALLAYQRFLSGRAGGERVVLAIVPFRFDHGDPMMVTYQQRVFDQLVADARAERVWTIGTEPAAATHVLSGSLTRDGASVKIFVELVVAGGRRHLWAEDIVDSYAFSGNSTLMGDRIERSVARVLGPDTSRGHATTR